MVEWRPCRVARHEVLIFHENDGIENLQILTVLTNSVHRSLLLRSPPTLRKTNSGSNLRGEVALLWTTTVRIIPRLTAYVHKPEIRPVSIVCHSCQMYA
jgi:hypothetical protein